MKSFGLLLLVVFLQSCLRDRVVPYTNGERSRGKVLVTFRFTSPSATSVYLAGDFNGWTVPRHKKEVFSHPVLRAYKMKRVRDYWQVVVPLEPGLHYYKFYINFSQWTFDDSSHEKTQTLDGDWRNIVIVK